ncbi:MAG TPA: RnfH family protein [Candidatus Competibacteraceae bacterium]|nr:RnfH family protein [Candidatus Competibacteraceae bacterium]
MGDAEAKTIKVEVAYARPDEQVIIPLEVAEGTTVEQAIAASRIQERFPEIDLALNKVGMFGKLSALGAVLRSGDRVEIYRPLIADPKEVRKQRAAEGKRMKKGGGGLETEEGG